MSIYKYIFPKKWYDYTEKNSSKRRQNRVANLWYPIIDDYFEGKIKKYEFFPKKDLGDNPKIIWQYWGQGVSDDTVPELVKICFASVDKFRGDYQVIRLSDTTLSEYVDIPDFVWEKRLNNPKFTVTFFSDLLRLILLRTYGGIWMDATILLTDEIPKEYTEMDYFVFQRSEDEIYKDYWFHVDPYYFCWESDFKVQMLSSIIFGKRDSEVLKALVDIDLCFWERSDDLKYYFTLHVFYHYIITRKLKDSKCNVVNDCTPHILQKKLMVGYPFMTFEEAFRSSPIHKLTYFQPDKLEIFKREYKLFENGMRNV